MRLYYSFVTGSTVLAGLAYGSLVSGESWSGTTVLVLILGYWAWGINQIFNDWGNLAEDRINAPHRPMVNGNLAIPPALILSGLLMLALGIASWLVNPWTLLPLGIGAVLNLVYCGAKGVPVIGCLVYGTSITSCFFYGYIASTGSAGGLPPFLDYGSLGFWDIALSVCLIHALMCHGSYFKDMAGDQAAGKRTFQVVFGYQAGLYAGIAATIPLLFYFWTLIEAGAQRESGPAEMGALAPTIAAVWSTVLLIVLYFRLFRREFHAAVLANCQTCAALTLSVTTVCSNYYLVAIAGTWVAIRLLFLWYNDEQE